MDFEKEIFEGKTFSGVLKDIYRNSKSKEKTIRELIEQLKNLITSPAEATLLVPILREYLDIAVKNDDSLIKMAGIVQRALSASGGSKGEEGSFSDKDREDLFGEIHKMTKKEKV